MAKMPTQRERAVRYARLALTNAQMELARYGNGEYLAMMGVEPCKAIAIRQALEANIVCLKAAVVDATRFLAKRPLGP